MGRPSDSAMRDLRYVGCVISANRTRWSHAGNSPYSDTVYPLCGVSGKVTVDRL